MKRLVTIAVASVMALSLTACGEHAPKKPEMNTTTETTETTHAVSAPAEEKAAEPAAESAAEHAPSESEAAGATTQE